MNRLSGSLSLIAGLALVAAAVAVPAHAAEGRIPLWTQTALGPGMTQGQYIVTRDIAAAPGSGAPAIDVIGGPGFEEIEIDLNGFTVFGDPVGGPFPVIRATGLRSFKITNGSVRHLGPGGNSVEVFNTEKAVIEDVKVTDGGVGLWLNEVQTFALRRNVVASADADGIVIIGPPPFAVAVPTSGVVEDSQVHDPLGNGIALFNYFSSVTLRNNQVEGAGGFGIMAAGFPPGPPFSAGSLIVAENAVQESGAAGIFLRDVHKGKVYNNTSHSNSGDGIALFNSNGFLLLDNVSGSNTGSGMVVGGLFNHVDRNVLTGNALAGLWFSPGSGSNTFGRNTSRGNAAAPGACAFAVAAVCAAPFAVPAIPQLCNDGPLNTTFCDNLMPGPPQG